jgi:hypothetical protein
MFWTDWHASHPRIERCAMDGDKSTRRVIFNVSNIQKSGWPIGLTIDYDAGKTKTNLYGGRLYWIDAK